MYKAETSMNRGTAEKRKEAVFMKKVYFGLDVSKGYCDVAILYDGEKQPSKIMQVDDHPIGWERIKEEMEGIVKKEPEIRIKLGLEHTGGYQRRWTNYFVKQKEKLPIEVYEVSPYKVKKYMEMRMKRNKTDKVSAAAIAEYLSIVKDVREFSKYHDGRRETMIRMLKYYYKQRIDLNRKIIYLKQLLYELNPAIAAICKSEIPGYVFRLLEKYPTTDMLSKAHLTSIEKIPYMKKEQAVKIKEFAKAANALSEIDEENRYIILNEIKSIEGLKKEHGAFLKRIEEFRKKYAPKNSFKIDTINGVGAFTALLLTALIWDGSFYASAKQIIAFIGINPSNNESGDLKKKPKISKKGDPFYRAELYFPLLHIITANPVLKSFYDKLLSKGKTKKTAIIACMAKLIRISYAIVLSNKEFDPEYQYKFKTKKTIRTTKEKTIVVQSEMAPISYKEHIKRKKGRSPQTESSSSSHGVNRPLCPT